ncbi:uncharacterized protein (TIGR02594 family) [Undibacterium sp. GrIS 1.8]|uniref:TIGR02594 family protein n=1 Tax=unclassified Undibacterium TaxID=2630295 RepID=UPI00339B166D
MPNTHVNESIDQKKDLKGNSRRGGDAPPEIQQKIVDIIIEEARKLQFNNRDIAYYIAIAKRESGFNPDAANSGSSASGVAQMQDDTGTTFGLNKTNRFDARASIKAGLQYFEKIKRKIISKYGSASDDYETLIYFCYHYGEFAINRRETVNGHVVVKEALPIATLKGNPKYADSKTVVDEAIRIEKILNDIHGLQIKLTDILGKPSAGRKVIVVQKKAVISADTESKSPAPAPAPAGPGPNSGGDANEASPDKLPKISATDDQSMSAAEAKPLSTDVTVETSVPIKWELSAIEMVTDGDGNIPEITSESQEPIVILIPRLEYEAYNEAVAKNEITEDGNKHNISLNSGEAGSLPAIRSPAVLEVKKVIPSPPKPKLEPKPASTKKDIFAAADASAKQAKPSTPTPHPDITFNDVQIALKQFLGWPNVLETSFSYMKQLYTRPMLPGKILDENIPTNKGKIRTQVISSSIKNQDAKTLTVKDKVTTAAQTAVQKVELTGDAPWMSYALKEQTKSNQIIKDGARSMEKDGTQKNDPDWKAEHQKRNNADAAIKKAKSELQKEKQKTENSKDHSKILERQQKIAENESIREEADQKMQEIEKKYNNEDIVKYLQSTNLDRDMARDDSTAWCSSFANWCVEQSGYRGSNSAAAESWKEWGEEMKEPRYGAIVVVTRATNPTKYHVGFFLNFGKRNILDGEEEIEVKGKNGELIKKKKKKFKQVDVVSLLSGNYSDQVKEGNEWTVLASENPAKHLVSYRWPTSKEKK